MSPESPEDRCSRPKCNSPRYYNIHDPERGGHVFVEQPPEHAVPPGSVCDVPYFDPSNGGGYCGHPLPCMVRAYPAPATAESPWVECERLRRLVDEAQARSACHAKNAEQALAECERLRAELDGLTASFAAQVRPLKAQLGRAVDYLKQMPQLLGHAGQIRPCPCRLCELVRDIAPSQPEPVKPPKPKCCSWKEMEPDERGGLDERTFCDGYEASELGRPCPAGYCAIDPDWHTPSQPEPVTAQPTDCDICKKPLPCPDHVGVPYEFARRIAEIEKAGIIKPPCEYCHDEGGKPECYACKKVMA